MDIKNGIPQSLATFFIAILGESNWCVTRPQEGQLLGHHEKRLQQVLSPIRGHALSARDVAAQVERVVGFWEQMDSVNRLLAILETQAHLRLLQARALVITEEQMGVTLYTAAN